MDDTNLGVASIYINNLLLSRGLLKNGTNVDFAHPERGDGGTDGTMAKVMGLVNDLILRRDVRPPFFLNYCSSAEKRGAVVSRLEEDADICGYSATRLSATPSLQQSAP